MATPLAAADSAPSIRVGPDGTATMHGDPQSTDTSPNPGPGAEISIASSVPGGTCSTVFIGSDELPVALCTAYIGTDPLATTPPMVVLLHPLTAEPLAKLQLAKGALLGGVYGYLDEDNRVVVADGNRNLLRIGHSRSASGKWSLSVDETTSLADAVPESDAITGLAPDWQGRTWFVTTNGVVGVVDTDRTVRHYDLPAGEKMNNGLSVRHGGVSVLTTHALYEMSADVGGPPRVEWRLPYERGPARKPGLLGHGSGTTPTYFGGDDGEEFVAITNDAPIPSLIVLRADDASEVCRMQAFESSGQGTEDSIMAMGNSLVIPSTYGFGYPPFAVDGPSEPANAPYVGGMTRIDVNPAGGCHRVWENNDRGASLPILSRADGLIHMLSYQALADELIPKVGPVYYSATDFNTGERVVTKYVALAPLDDPLQLTGTLARDGSYWQPTFSRVFRISPQEGAFDWNTGS